MKLYVKVHRGVIDCKSVNLIEFINKYVDVYYNGRKLNREPVIVKECVYKGYRYGRLTLYGVNLPDGYYEVEIKLKLRLSDDIIFRLCYGKFISAKYVNELTKQLTLEEKVELSHRVIEEAVRITKLHCKDPKFSVAYSGGKASTVVLDLVLRHIPKDDLYVIFCDTGNEYPENLRYVVKVCKEYFKVKYLIIAKSKIPPFQLWKKFGFPSPSRYRHREPICCLILKKLPAAVAIKKFDIVCEFLGLQMFESRSRLAIIDRRGLIHETSFIGPIALGKLIYRVVPIAFWTDEDIWIYLEKNNIPINPVYERYGINRQGCIFCTNTLNWEKRIEHVCTVMKHPELFNKLMELYKRWGVQKQRQISAKKVLREFGFQNPEDAIIIKVI